MKIKLFLDGADLDTIEALGHKADGFTTNPSLMRKAGITDYREFAKEVLARADGKSVSFEVLADDAAGMKRDAEEIASWGENVWVKIPVVNTHGDWNYDLIRELSLQKIKVNVTAILTTTDALGAWTSIRDQHSFISIFAGRIADCGQDPQSLIRHLVNVTSPRARILWASTRQVFSVIEAERAGADIITLQPELFRKLDQFGRNLDEYTQETVQQFARDAAGIKL